MKAHHKEIIKFIFQPVTKPITCIAKEIWDTIKTMCKTLLSEDGDDAWAVWVVLMFVMVVSIMIASFWIQVILWKTGVAMAIISYCTLYYVRDYKKRQKNDS